MREDEESVTRCGILGARASLPASFSAARDEDALGPRCDEAPGTAARDGRAPDKQRAAKDVRAPVRLADHLIPLADSA